MKPTVLCIGGANLDRKLRLSEPLRMGTSNPVMSEVSPGGVARNVAENLARLGCKVRLLSTFSDDLEGNWLLDHLNSAGVDVSPSFIVPGRKSGSYTALQDAQGEMLLAMALGSAFSGIIANYSGFSETSSVEAAQNVAFWCFAAFIPQVIIGTAGAWKVSRA